MNLTTEEQDILDGVAYPAHETWPDSYDLPQTIVEWNKRNSDQIHQEFEEEEKRQREYLQNSPTSKAIRPINTLKDCAIFKTLKKKTK